MTLVQMYKPSNLEMFENRRIMLGFVQKGYFIDIFCQNTTKGEGNKYEFNEKS
jgi:hypothetical protein